MPADLVPTQQMQPLQVQITNKLFAMLIAEGVSHEIALGSLMSLYRCIAIAHPCCLGESIEITSAVLRELIQLREATPAHRANHH